MLGRRKVVLAANAVPRVGGQGMMLDQMLNVLQQHFELTVFCRSDCECANTRAVPGSRLSAIIGRVPILRRLRDWQTFFSDSHFDGYVSQRLPETDLFQAISGHCAKSLATAKRRGCVTVLDVGTTHINDFSDQQEKECARFGIRPTTTIIKRRILKEYERADVIRVMSKHAQNTFLERGFSADRVVVVPPPIEMNKFPVAAFGEPKFRVSFVGLIEPWKGFHYLVEAFNALKIADSELLLWGGPGSRPVKRYLREQMTHNPNIRVQTFDRERDGYAEVYGRSSVVVLPSLSDGFGFVVAEAMASGVPVIVTLNTGAVDMVLDGKNGFIVPTRDRKALAERLSYLAANPKVLREMGCQARTTAEAFTFERFCRQYIPLLEGVISRRQGPCGLAGEGAAPVRSPVETPVPLNAGV